MHIVDCTRPVARLLAFVLSGLLAQAAHAQVGTVEAWQKIGASSGGFGGGLGGSDFFGWATAGLGDLDGDGIPDLAVGAAGDLTGAVWITFLNADGTVSGKVKIDESTWGFGGDLDVDDRFGGSLASLGDLDGNGLTALAVGAFDDDDGGAGRGAVWILFLNAFGGVNGHQKISATQGGFGGTLHSFDGFGYGVVSLGDLDGDGIADLAVGAPGDDDGSSSGALWILFLNGNGTVKAEQKISATSGGFGGTLAPNGYFGRSVTLLGDLDGDGTRELAVGSPFAAQMGEVWILHLNTDGTVAAQSRITEAVGGFGGDLDFGDNFGWTVGYTGDLDGDGVGDLSVSTPGDDDGGVDRGALWILFLKADGTVKAHQKISATAGGFGGQLDDRDWLGWSVAALGDLDGDGVTELAAGAIGDDDGGAGATWILFLEGQSCVSLDFETEDDLVTPLQNGQHIDGEFGLLVSLTSSGPNAGLAIFDSTVGGPNDPSQDRDLLVGTGNLLILQTENYPPDANDVFPRPNDDEDGGTISFAFVREVAPQSVRLIDLDAGDGVTTVVLRDAFALRRTYTVPGNWTGDLLLGQPGHGVLGLTTLAPQPGFGSTATASEDAGFDPSRVLGIDVHLDGSGALDDLDLCSSSFVRASARPRNGSGTNPVVLRATSPPAFGSVWTAVLDCAALDGGSSNGLALLEVRSRASPGRATPFGEVLTSGAMLHRARSVYAGAPSSFSLPIPVNLALEGLPLHVQGFCLGQSSPAAGSKLRTAHAGWTNALDLVIGF